MRRHPSQRHQRNAAIAVLMGWLCQSVIAGSPSEIDKARALSVGCLGCHGTLGEGQGNLPPLKTLDRETFIQRFQAYANNERSASVMHRIARGYTAKEIRLMADFLSAGSPP